MEKFYFCNFLGKSLNRTCNKGVTKVEVSDRLSENVQLAKSYITGEGSNLSLNFVCEDEKCVDGTEFDFIGTFNAEDKRVKSTVEELSHTEENPIILVATKSFKIFNGIPTYIKYVPVKDGVLVALIKGYIAVMDVDGELIPLSRNCNVYSTDKGKVFGVQDTQNLNALPDKESDVMYSDYVVNDCIISIETTKDGRDTVNLKFSRNNFSYLYKEVFEEAKLAKEEAKRKKIEERERRAAENAKFMEEQREKARRVEEEKKEAKKGKSKEQKENVQTGFEGAQSFLAYVEGLKKGQ